MVGMLMNGTVRPWLAPVLTGARLIYIDSRSGHSKRLAVECPPKVDHAESFYLKEIGQSILKYK